MSAKTKGYLVTAGICVAVLMIIDKVDALDKIVYANSYS
jgi:hypothetical protein